MKYDSLFDVGCCLVAPHGGWVNSLRFIGKSWIGYLISYKNTSHFLLQRIQQFTKKLHTSRSSETWIADILSISPLWTVRSCEHSRVWRWRRVCEHSRPRREHRSRSRSRNWHRCYRRRQEIQHSFKEVWENIWKIKHRRWEYVIQHFYVKEKLQTNFKKHVFFFCDFLFNTIICIYINTD